MSRTTLDGCPLGDVERDFMLDLIRRYSALYLVEILGFCLTQLNSLFQRPTFDSNMFLIPKTKKGPNL
jgi:hypothetical protein